MAGGYHLFAVAGASLSVFISACKKDEGGLTGTSQNVTITVGVHPHRGMLQQFKSLGLLV